MCFRVFTLQEHYFKWEMTLLVLSYWTGRIWNHYCYFSWEMQRLSCFWLSCLYLQFESLKTWLQKTSIWSIQLDSVVSAEEPVIGRPLKLVCQFLCLHMGLSSYTETQLFKCFLREELFRLQKTEIIPVHFYLFLQRWCYEIFLVL